MASRITRHFPIVRFRGEQKLWFNPVQKVRAADRPEERVRLRTIEFLVREAGFSINRMSTEIGIKSEASESPIRTDILCFDTFHRPLLLVECKSESVKLDEKTAIQGARYNRTVKAPYILLTNGLRDILFAIREDDSPEPIQDISTIFPLQKETFRDIDYWVDRGFWSAKSQIHNNETDLLAEWLETFWFSDAAQTQYLPLQIPADLSREACIAEHISTYARIFPRTETGRRSALALFRTFQDHTKGFLITTNTGAAPDWMIFDVTESDGSLNIHHLISKKGDEKCGKIPDNLKIELTAGHHEEVDSQLLNLLQNI